MVWRSSEQATCRPIRTTDPPYGTADSAAEGPSPTVGGTNSMKAALLEYLAGLEVSQRRKAGQSLEVLPWQRRFLRARHPERGVVHR